MLYSLMFCHITTVTAVMARTATDQKKHKTILHNESPVKTCFEECTIAGQCMIFLYSQTWTISLEQNGLWRDVVTMLLIWTILFPECWNNSVSTIWGTVLRTIVYNISCDTWCTMHHTMHHLQGPWVKLERTIAQREDNTAERVYKCIIGGLEFYASVSVRRSVRPSMSFYLSCYLACNLPSYLSCNVSGYLPFHLSACLSIFIYLPVYLPTGLSIYIFPLFYPSLSFSIYLFLSLSIYISVYLSLSVFIHLYLSLSTYFYLYLFLSVSIYLYLNVSM